MESEESTWVGEPDIAFRIHKEIIHSVEVPAEIVIQKRGRLVGIRI